MAWKSIKEYAKNQGVERYSPRAYFKEAFRLKLIEYDEQWLEMIKDRNATAHVYKESQANRIYSKLTDYLALF